ncbi:MAG: RNA polymerase sigma factor [Bacteroidia bacterium]
MAANETNFRELVETHKQRVFNTALGFMQHVEDAEDVSQEVFIEVHRSLHTFKEEAQLSTWIYRITVNKCLDQLRSRNRKKRFAFITGIFHKESGELNHDAAHFDHPGIQLERKENARYLFEAMETLPENQKTAFVLATIEDLPQKEIAGIMNISLKAVESLIQRAKVNLRKKLENVYDKRRIHEK